jgi:hypothetical protein
MITNPPNQRSKPHNGWDNYMHLERMQLAERAEGKMARMIGKTRDSENQEEIDLIVIDDQFMAQNGYAPLRQGDKVWHVHIDEMTHEDRLARVEYEKTLVRWLRQRFEGEKIEAELRKNGLIPEDSVKR